MKLTTAEGLITALSLADAGENGTDLPLMAYGYQDGNLTTVTKPSGATTTFVYDESGRLVRVARGWLFEFSLLLVVTTQLPVTRWAGSRLALRHSMAVELLLTAAGFAVVAVAVPAGWTGTAGLLSATSFVVPLTFGQMLVAPHCPRLGVRPRRGGTARPLHRGIVLGLGPAVSLGSTAGGSLLDSGLPPAVPWLALAALPAAAIGLPPRRGATGAAPHIR